MLFRSCPIQPAYEGDGEEVTKTGDFQGSQGGVLEGESFVPRSISWVGGQKSDRGAVVSDEGLFRGEGAGGEVCLDADTGEDR